MSGSRGVQPDRKCALSANPESGMRSDQPQKLTQARARELLDYDHLTGIVRWKKLSGRRAKVGDICSTMLSSGYLLVGIDSRRYLLHRVIWLLVYGYFPEHDIDHINRVRTDNRLDNLREVSRSCNLKNCSRPSDNTSGVKGVSWHQARSQWQAYINGSERHRKGLGWSEDFVEAVCLRLAAEQCLDWGSCDSASSAAKFMKDYLDRRTA